MAIFAIPLCIFAFYNFVRLLWCVVPTIDIPVVGCVCFLTYVSMDVPPSESYGIFCEVSLLCSIQFLSSFGTVPVCVCVIVP